MEALMAKGKISGRSGEKRKETVRNSVEGGGVDLRERDRWLKKISAWEEGWGWRRG